MSSSSTDEEPVFTVVGDRVALGPARRELAPLWARYLNDPAVRHTLGNLNVIPLEGEHKFFDERVEGWMKRPPEGAGFTIYDRSDNAPVGTCGLFSVEWNDRRCEFGIFIGDRRGTGIGSEATRLTLDFAFNSWGLSNVMLRCSPANAPAVRAYEKAGFRRIGLRRNALVIYGERGDELLMDAIPEDFGESVIKPARTAPGTSR